MLSSFPRVLLVAVLTTGLLVAGLVGPVAGEPAPDLPDTVARTLDGLPAGAKDGRASRTITTPIPFSMVGFEVPAGTSLEFRTSVDGVTWGPWTDATVEPDEGPDATSAEGRAANRRMSAPVWVGEAAHLQTRSRGIAAAAKVRQVTAHVIDSSGLSRSWGRRMLDRLGAAWRGTPPPAAATTAQPDFVTRSEWGADESLRRSSPSYGSRIVAGFVHHTVNANGYSRAEADDLVRGIYRYHVSSRGWSDIGYNFLVDRFGTVYEGRYGGVTKPVVGAHASGFNTNTFGVSLIGNFVSARPPAAMVSSLRHMLAWKFDLHHINVLGRVDYESATINRLSGHRDVGSTSCPGGKVYDLLPALRRSVAELQGPVILHHQVSPDSVDVKDGQSVSGPVTFKARLRPAGAWTLAVTDRDGSVVHTASGNSRLVAHEWLPTGVAPGRYRYRIASPDRLAARGTLRMMPPRITATARPGAVRYRRNGMLYRPIAITGTMYDTATWALRIFDPDGVRVMLTRGTGSTLAASWRGPVTHPGTYEWRLVVDGELRKKGPLRIYADRVARIASPTRSADAVASISRTAFDEGTAQRAVVVVASASAYALAAGGLAGSDGPILLTGPNRVPAGTLAELKRALAPAATVYVLGSESVVSDAVVDTLVLELRRPVVRVEGTSPTRTAAAAADVVADRSGTASAVLVGGSGVGAWRQGLGGSAAAALEGSPVLLTARDRLSPATRRALVRNGITRVTIVGNGTTVSTAARRQLPASVTEVRRVSGSSGSKTAVNVARLLFGRAAGTAQPDDRYVFLNASRRDGWVRSLTAAPLAARTRAPLLFTRRTGVSGSTATYLQEMAYEPHVLGQGVVLGNVDHVSNATRTTLARLLQ